MTIRAHFDGTVIVPDEPVNLPVGKPLDVDVREPANGVSPEVAAAMEAAKDPAVRAKRLAALREFLALTANDPVIPVELLRREHLYD
jgi:hypothetical protein